MLASFIHKILDNKEIDFSVFLDTIKISFTENDGIEKWEKVLQPIFGFAQPSQYLKATQRSDAEILNLSNNALNTLPLAFWQTLEQSLPQLTSIKELNLTHTNIGALSHECWQQFLGMLKTSNIIRLIINESELSQEQKIQIEKIIDENIQKSNLKQQIEDKELAQEFLSQSEAETKETIQRRIKHLLHVLKPETFAPPFEETPTSTTKQSNEQSNTNQYYEKPSQTQLIGMFGIHSQVPNDLKKQVENQIHTEENYKPQLFLAPEELHEARSQLNNNNSRKP